jgi:signal transduction histidine kinase
VDDDEDDYQITRALAREVQHARILLDWEPDYDAALKAICAGSHDVYLIDYLLGHRTGLELLREAKASACSGPFILLTGQGEPEIDRAATDAGAADYLEKSRLDEIVLERMIRYAIRQHSQEAELERKVRERTEALERANATLLEADRRKDVFLAMLAHELRNPLAPIRNALELQRMMADDPASVEEARGIMARQVDLLTRLIDDLLDASRLTRGKLSLHRETLDLHEIVALATETSRVHLDRTAPRAAAAAGGSRPADAGAGQRAQQLCQVHGQGGPGPVDGPEVSRRV